MEKVRKICVIGPSPSIKGGMSLQANLLSRRLREEGIGVLRVSTNPPLPRALRFLSEVRGVRTLFKTGIYLLQLLGDLPRADTVHLLASSHLSFFIDSCPAILLSRLFRKRLILNYRGGEAEIFFNRWRKVAIPLLRKADALTVPSGFLKAVFAKFGLPSRIIPNIVDLEIFVFRPPETLRERLINTRHLEPVYNIDCVLNAFRIVKERLGGVRLVLAGSGSEEERLRGLAKEWGLRNTEFLGGVNHSELAELYGGGGVFVNASRADNMPNSILEAFASGLPVVSTRTGGIPYLIRHEENGLLVGPDDHEGLAREVIRLFEDRKLARRLAENARRDCEKKYSWKAVREQLFKIYAGERRGE